MGVIDDYNTPNANVELLHNTIPVLAFSNITLYQWSNYLFAIGSE
jgi:hypothetical protein